MYPIRVHCGVHDGCQFVSSLTLPQIIHVSICCKSAYSFLLFAVYFTSNLLCLNLLQIGVQFLLFLTLSYLNSICCNHLSLTGNFQEEIYIFLPTNPSYNWQLSKSNLYLPGNKTQLLLATFKK